MKPNRPWPALGIALFLAIDLRAASLHVQIRALDAACSASGMLQLSGLGADGSPEPPSQPIPFTATPDAHLDLVLNTFPQVVHISMEGCWAQEVRVEREETDPIDVNVTSAAEVRLAFRHTKQAPEDPHGLSVELRPVGATRRRLAWLRDGLATVSCKSDRGTWRCDAPRGTFDLRVLPGGFSPQYLFDVAIPSDSPSLATIPLERGASIIGWTRADRTADIKDLASATIELSPVTMAEATPAAIRIRANSRGFFRYSNVPSGRYRTAATAPHASPSKETEIAVKEAREYELAAPLVLEGLGAAALTLVPATDSEGRSWGVELRRPVGPGGYYEVAAAGTAAGGLYSATALPAGHYDVAIKDLAGNVRRRDSIEVAPGPSTSAILKLDQIAVDGLVRAGQRPVAGSLRWTDMTGESVTWVSNEEGHFRGELPHEGKWNVVVSPEKTTLKIKASLVNVQPSPEGERSRVEVLLGSGRAHGTLTDEKGKPVVAVVMLRNPARLSTAAVQSEEDGTFDLIGLDIDEELMVQAANRSGDSGVVKFIANETGTPPLNLTLKSRVLFEARVVTASGLPVTGALVKFATPSQYGIGQTVTGPTGRFEVTLVKDTPIVHLVIMPAGLPMKFVSIPLDEPSDGPREIVLAGGGLLIIKLGRTPPWPFLMSGGALFPTDRLLYPEGADGNTISLDGENYVAQVEPGVYAVCPTPVLTVACVSMPIGEKQVKTIDGASPDFWGGQGKGGGN